MILAVLAAAGARARSTLADRALAGAFLVGTSLRLGWVVFATRAPSGPLSDPAHYLRAAERFAAGRTMVAGAVPSAFYPPGYPLVLTPLAWLSARTGLFSTVFAATLLNAAAGAWTITGVASLAREWFGPREARWAAWLWAIAPGPILWTASPMSDGLFTALAVAAVVMATRLWAGRGGRAYAALGVLVGLAGLVRTPGLVLVVLPLLVAASRAPPGSRRRALRTAAKPTLVVAAASCAVLAPWMVRNGREVGIWSPTSTNNVAFLCLGNWPGADGRSDSSVAEGERCFRRSPFDDARLYGPDAGIPAGFVFRSPEEPRWYRDTLSATVSWMARHPGRVVELIPARLWNVFRNSSEALNDAEDFGARRLVGGGLRAALLAVAAIWEWMVLLLAAAALVARPRARAAVPLWAGAILLLLPATLGIGLQRLQLPVIALAAVLCAALLGSRPRRARAMPLDGGRDDSGGDDSGGDDSGGEGRSTYDSPVIPFEGTTPAARNPVRSP